MNKIKLSLYLIIFVLIFFVIGCYFKMTSETLAISGAKAKMYSESQEEINNYVNNKIPNILKEVEKELSDKNDYLKSQKNEIAIQRELINTFENDYKKIFTIFVVESIILLTSYILLNNFNKLKVINIITLTLLALLFIGNITNLNNMFDFYSLDAFIIPLLLLLYIHLSIFILKKEIKKS